MANPFSLDDQKKQDIQLIYNIIVKLHEKYIDFHCILHCVCLCVIISRTIKKMYLVMTL